MAATLVGSTVFAASPAAAAGPMCQGVAATIIGTTGDDVLSGTAGNDVIVGLAGADIIYGRGGDDLICGGQGGDQIFGGSGEDEIFGNAGPDYVDGEWGNDYVHGGWGIDTVVGGAGADELYGSRNADEMYGGDGNDVMFGGRGHDQMWGGKHSDLIAGGNGNDLLYGESGEDRLRPGLGGGANFGGAGFDFISGVREAVADPNPTGPTPLATPPEPTTPTPTAPPTTSAPAPTTETEFEIAVGNEIFRLVNCARTGSANWCRSGDGGSWNVRADERRDTNGNALRPYIQSTSLSNGAKAWSETMANTGNFAHGQPNGWWGENIAWFSTSRSQSVESVAAQLMNQWMNSTTGHREAILNKTRYVTFGAGIEVDGNGYYGTQWFAGAGAAD